MKDLGPIVGIDFGTSGLKVAALVDGRPVMLEDAEWESTTPATVMLRADGMVAIGAGARPSIPRSGLVVVHAAKRLLGRSWSDPVIADHKGELGDALRKSEAVGTPT